MWLARFGSKWLLTACGALLVLLVLAAVMQYRWIHQISDADRQQRHELLEAAMRGFRSEFDAILREPMRIYRPNPSLRPGTVIEPYLGWRRGQWEQESNHPLLLNAVCLGMEAKDGLSFKCQHLGEEQFTAEAWPEELAQYRTILEKRLRQPGGNPPLFPRGHAHELVDGRPVLIFPLVEDGRNHDEPDQPPPPDARSLLRSLQPQPMEPAGHAPELKGWCFLEFDLGYIKQRLLPELIEHHFGQGGLDNYQLAVITGVPARLIYRSNAALTVETLSSVDAGMAIFGREAQGSGMEPEPGRMGPPRPLPPPPRSGDGQPRVRRPGPPPPPPSEQRPEPPPDAPDGRPGPPPEREPNPDDWHLVAKYSSGSLDAAVDQARWRNLALSFGVLLILAGSMAVLMLAAQRARRLATQQMEFVAGVSHELRTPLAVIQSTSYNLAQGMIGDARRVQQYGEVIQSESRRLINQVEQMLSFAGIQSGHQHYDLRPTQIADIIERAFAAYAAEFAAGEWQVEQKLSADLPPVLADAQALESAIKNLLQNALKYAAQGKYLSVSTRTAPQGNRTEVQITVADRGPGIDAKDLPRIFDPFYRGKKVWDSAVPGTGLGLSLVERHVQAHGGRVTVQTAPGHGASFTLHLPALEAVERNATTDTNESQNPDR